LGDKKASARVLELRKSALARRSSVPRTDVELALEAFATAAESILRISVFIFRLLRRVLSCAVWLGFLKGRILGRSFEEKGYEGIGSGGGVGGILKKERGIRREGEERIKVGFFLLFLFLFFGGGWLVFTVFESRAR